LLAKYPRDVCPRKRHGYGDQGGGGSCGGELTGPGKKSLLEKGGCQTFPQRRKKPEKKKGKAFFFKGDGEVINSPEEKKERP